MQNIKSLLRNSIHLLSSCKPSFSFALSFPELSLTPMLVVISSVLLDEFSYYGEIEIIIERSSSSLFYPHFESIGRLSANPVLVPSIGGLFPLYYKLLGQ